MRAACAVIGDDDGGGTDCADGIVTIGHVAYTEYAAGAGFQRGGAEAEDKEVVEIADTGFAHGDFGHGDGSFAGVLQCDLAERESTARNLAEIDSGRRNHQAGGRKKAVAI